MPLFDDVVLGLSVWKTWGLDRGIVTWSTRWWLMDRVGTVEGMFGFPSSELRACVCRSRDTDGWTAPDRTVGLRLRSDPLEQHGRVWQWVVDLNPGLPTLTDVLVNCYDFLVDDDCGREVGVVERVEMEPDSAVPGRLQVVQGWGRHRITVSVDDVIEVAPGERRLVIACRAGHRKPLVEPARERPGGPPDTGGRVRLLVALLAGRRAGRVRRK